LFGPFEFIDPLDSSNSNLNPLVNIYSKFQYNFGVLSKKEKQLFLAKGISIPSFWKTVDNEINFYLLDDKLVILVLPFIEGKKDLAYFSEQVEQVVKKIVNKYPFLPLIAISSWGEYWEDYYLQYYKPDIPVFLGSGPGRAIEGRVVNHGRTLWVRPYSKGKAVFQIDITDYEKYKQQNKWLYKENFFWKTHWLGNKIYPDPEVSNFIEKEFR